jgi:hypothetical protein
MNIKKSVLCLIILYSFLSISAIAQSKQDTLKQYLAELQKNPLDNPLRKKIILLSQKISPTPTLPEEARKNFVMGMALLNEAKTKEDYQLVITKFKSSLSAAPWYSEAYKQLGLTQELSGNFDEAIANIGFYMLSPLSEIDKQKAQDEIYIIEAKKEKAISSETLKKKEEDSFATYLLKNEGAVFSNNTGRGGWAEIVIEKGVILLGERHTDESWLKLNPDDSGKLCRIKRYTFKEFIEKVFEDDFYGGTQVDANGNRMYRIWTFLKDGKTISVNYESFDKIRYDMVYKRIN